jgi:hypothetical protein
MKSIQGALAMVLAIAASTSVMGGEPPAVAPAAQGAPARLEGDWGGKLDAGGLRLRVILQARARPAPGSHRRSSRR